MLYLTLTYNFKANVMLYVTIQSNTLFTQRETVKLHAGQASEKTLRRPLPQVGQYPAIGSRFKNNLRICFAQEPTAPLGNNTICIYNTKISNLCQLLINAHKFASQMKK